MTRSPSPYATYLATLCLGGLLLTCAGISVDCVRESNRFLMPYVAQWGIAELIGAKLALDGFGIVLLEYTWHSSHQSPVKQAYRFLLVVQSAVYVTPCPMADCPLAIPPYLAALSFPAASLEAVFYSLCMRTAVSQRKSSKIASAIFGVTISFSTKSCNAFSSFLKIPRSTKFSLSSSKNGCWTMSASACSVDCSSKYA